MSFSAKNTVIIILGPTGVGKTALSILIAKALRTEIISADSMQIYRQMDIGTAKPSAEELGAVPHQMINILSPTESFSVGIFREKAEAAINGLHARNMIPLIVGGTGLYIRALTEGLFEGPAADWPLREKLMEDENVHGSGYLYKYLLDIDPVAAEKINLNDLRRTVRALEVSLKEKKGISECQRSSTKPMDCNFIKIGLLRTREELYSMIEKRVDKMMDEGLLEETESLLRMGPERTALQALGYKEMAQHLRGEIALKEAVRLTKKRTKMYAKRQFTWFNKEPGINWVDITGIITADEIYDRVLNEVEILREILYS